MKWPALSTYTTGGLRDWSEKEEQVNGSFGSPHHGNRGARRRRAHASAAVSGEGRLSQRIICVREISLLRRRITRLLRRDVRFVIFGFTVFPIFKRNPYPADRFGT